METINSMATTASKIIMGEGNSSKEPVSGVRGDVTQGEPYDAGNLETPGQQQVEKRLELAESETKPNGTTAATTQAPSNGTLEKKEDVNEAPKPDDNTEESNGIKEDEDEPPSPKGPGPRPLPLVAKEHHGDAGRIDDETLKTKSDQTPEENPNETENDESKAPTQEYVKSTGFAAEGGDFDATKPGAGKEADRLLGKGGASHDDSESPDKTSSKSKPSLGERIKAKLHKH